MNDGIWSPVAIDGASRKYSGKLSSGDKLFWQGGGVEPTNQIKSNRQTNKQIFSLPSIERARKTMYTR